MNKFLTYSVIAIVSSLVLGIGLTYLVISGKDKNASIETASQPEESEETAEYPYPPPSMDDVPEGEDGDLIKLGFKYVTETATALDGYSGNNLSCASCHAGGGYEEPLDLVGISKTYPQYNPRAGREVTLEERINGCFRRSMNGEPLPEDSQEMKAMVAFYDYISQNVPDGTTERPWAKLDRSKADIENVDIDAGREIYNKACISCHGENGDAGNLALWGENSYNIGAGMARLRTAAGFIQTYMPKMEIGGYSQGSLTDEEAMNLAAYINSHDRPDFPDKIYDWPKGDAPDDAAYETLAGKKGQDKEKE
ncbi:c-type cytochrome [Bacillus sp. ISL-47]|uniref:c-type cytochrome n=1 Tax=Bacillus sp. ISL-47 TaxID=2819130 RepID=UPI001BEBDEC8|nr:c-type cytochrome [Bacillus sp. ISL-47]MBT2687347.1 c-type cytochrome [Bacillus sp. ISL-47]MBT2706583.1 c-type cytochrome [Pseudomonas sp. ISL-84]